jgi:uncharacterized membrane protein HdeD (DUF308 family)
MFKSLSTSLITRGILAVIIGIVALAWPSATVLALVVMFAVCAFIAAGLQAARAFSSRDAGPVIGHLLLALAAIAFGVVLCARPGIGGFIFGLLAARLLARAGQGRPAMEVRSGPASGIVNIDINNQY